MKIALVSGALANKPYNGGAAWTRLNYILGLRRLGFDVYFVEQIQPDVCVDECGRRAAFKDSVNLSYFKKIMTQFNLNDRSVLIYGNAEQIEGSDYGRIFELARDAALLLNISGHLHLDRIKKCVPVKAYIDLDPGYTQFWDTTGQCARLAHHDYYFTVGENIGFKDCSIPANGIEWRPTRQPVVLEHWNVSTEGDAERFTTVASWRGPFGPIETAGKSLGAKVRQFRKYISLPSNLSERFEVALDIDPADGRDLDLLSRNSWNIVDPRTTVPDPLAFRQYVRTSGAEFSVAQQIYVETSSGWFSDRSVRYLASGKPVLVEDTGFSRNYPTGAGLLAFSSLDQAIAGVKDITRSYSAHAQAARAIAETYFDSDRVLGALVDQMGICS